MIAKRSPNIIDLTEMVLQSSAEFKHIVAEA